MHRFPTAVVLALLAALALGGCLEAKAKLALRADGKGTWQQTSTVQLEKARAYCAMLVGELRELEPPDGERARHEDAFPDLDVDKRTKALARRKGIRVVEADRTSDAKTKKHTTRLTVAFDSLQALFESGAVEDASATLAKTKTGAWKLTIRHAHLDSGSKSAPEALREVRAEMLERFKPYWGTLLIEMTLALPTRVLETNGVALGARSVTWTIRFADLADPKKLVQEVTFADAKDLKLRPFTAAFVEADDK